MTTETNFTESGSSPPHYNKRKTHCPQGHVYDEANTLVKRGVRYCRACNREYLRARRRAMLKPERCKTPRPPRQARQPRSEQERALLRLARWSRRNWRRYGIVDLTWERFVLTVEQQGGVCAICQNPPRRERLHADHDHSSGRFRAALCNPCNANLANFERGKRVSRAMARKFRAYLKQAA